MGGRLAMLSYSSVCQLLRERIYLLTCSFTVAACSLFLYTNISFAQSNTENIKVFKNRYVIELNDSALHADAIGRNSLESNLQKAGAESLRSLSGQSGKKLKVVRSIKHFDQIASSQQEGTLVTYDSKDQFCIDLIKSGAVKSCSPDFEIRALATTPNDPSIGSLWGMSAQNGIDASGAWDYHAGSGDVVVAVIDTGVDYNHPDLAANMWINSGEIQNNGRDDDNNGFIDDIYGWNSANQNGNPMDDNGHGTHVSGTIGGVGNNAIGVAGVNWNVKIMALKFLDANGSGSLSGAIDVINYMVLMKSRGVNIRVSNNSWGGGSFSQALYNAILSAQNAGIIFVAAAGNESNNNDSNPSYPAGYQLPNVISVGATDSNRNLASFSNYGANSVHIAAPGVGILSTFPGGGYGSLSGTSMATPHVAGALALLISYEPGLSILGAKERLLLTGLPVSSLNSVISTGRLANIARMLRNETSPVAAPTPTPAPCSYSISQITFQPDTTVESSETIIQADEFNYHEVVLPFSFPYFREQVGRIFVSPNGVVYTKNAPAGMDYQNSSEAPLNAIAALHTDLTTANAPHGVKVNLGADRVSIYWLAETYESRAAGDIKAWLTIYADGTIDDFVAFENNKVQTYIQDRATVGIAGSFEGNSSTYAYNNSAVKDKLAIRFSPQCGDSGGGDYQGGTVSKIKIFGKNGNRSTKSLEPGKKLVVKMIGSGSGSIELKAYFNDKSCPISAAVPFNSGVTLSGRLPKVSNEVSSLKIRVGNTKKGAQIHHYRNGRIQNSSTRKISARKLISFCSKFLSSLTEE